VLVTGAAGFIGRHLVKTLTRDVPDVAVIGLDREFNMSGCAQQVVCDLSGSQAFQTIPALEPIDYVIHLAAQSDVDLSSLRPDIYIKDNILATSNLIQALASQESVKRFLLVSSAEVYGNTATLAAEADVPKPRSPCATSKLAQEYFVVCDRSPATSDRDLSPFQQLWTRAAE
jgi:nucleoside-diphosphate-sugar epimerase